MSNMDEPTALERFHKRLAAINGDYKLANLSRMAENLNDIRDTLSLIEDVPEAQEAADVLRDIRDSLRGAVDRLVLFSEFPGEAS